jgi:hypothetical protein
LATYLRVDGDQHGQRHTVPHGRRVTMPKLKPAGILGLRTPIGHNREGYDIRHVLSLEGDALVLKRLDEEEVEQLVIGGHNGLASSRTAGNGRGYGGRTRHSSLMRAGPFPTEAPRGIGKRGRTRTCGDRNQNPAPLPAWRRAHEFGPANGSSTREVQR